MILAAACAALGGIPVLGLTHGHHWIGFAAIAVQMILLVMAAKFFRDSRMLISAGRK